ncbi:Centromere protein U [Chelonia mydas]|uniref:Centromere protein U n=1 Tax=Chelonia mydas TaxID=8469 RepID=M7BUJ5_CHEMY|nr:Centromere protein U [Chelonia mydas]
MVGMGTGARGPGTSSDSSIVVDSSTDSNSGANGNSDIENDISTDGTFGTSSACFSVCSPYTESHDTISRVSLQVALDEADAATRVMATGAARRRSSWLQVSGLLYEIQQTIQDLPFEDHPLHSTAVDAGGNVELQEEEHDMSASHSSDSSPQGKNAETRKNHCSLKMTEDNKSETEDSEDESLKENKILGNSKSSVEESKLPSALALRNSSSESSISNKVTDLVKKLNAQKIWCPKGLKRFSQDITELDVVLAEFEKTTADYK